MGPDQTVEIMRRVLIEAMLLSAPLLVTAALVSLAVSVLQTLTSVQGTDTNCSAKISGCVRCYSGGVALDGASPKETLHKFCVHSLID